MATKPTELPEWATDETNNTEPSAGQKDTGWEESQVAISSYFNWWQFAVWKWIEFLNDALVNFGAANVQAATLTGTAINGGTIQSSVAMGALPNTHIYVSGTGDYKHGDKQITIPASAAQPDSTATYTFVASAGGGSARNHWAGGNGTSALVFPIVPKVGDQIKSVVAFVRDTTGTHTISMSLSKTTATAGGTTDANTAIGSTQTSVGNGNIQTLSVTGLTEVVVTNTFYQAYIQNNDATTTTHKIYGIVVTYDRP